MKTTISRLLHGLAVLATLSALGWRCPLAAVPPAPETSRLALPASDDGLPGAGPIRRYAWFTQKWLDRRTVWAARVAPDQGAVVFLGDSITEGWGDDLKGAFPGLKIANRGIGGDTTRGMLLRLQDDVLALHPAGVVLLAGTNDLEERADPATSVTNLKLILAAIHAAAPKAPVVVCEVFPSSATKQRPTADIRRLNELYAEVARSDSQVTLLDTWTLYADAAGDAPIAEFPDLLHPNAAGYAKWAAALRPVLATLGFLETATDEFVPEPGFESLFNGHDLTGWGLRPTTDLERKQARDWQAADPKAAAWPFVDQAIDCDGQRASPDGRFVAIAGRLVVTTPPEGRRIQTLWTTREFPRNFVLKVEFRATPNADSGVFLRGLQLQCRDYRLAGPYKQLQHYRPQEWNELVVTVTDNVAVCTCNGEMLEAALRLPATGPIGLEGDRGQMEYRRLRVLVLP